jgi:hypothetical protein
MLTLNSMIAVYDTQADVETGLRELHKSTFDLTKVSIVGREHESGEYAIGYLMSGGRMSYWGPRGVFWNGLWKDLDGAAYFSIPGIGGVLIAGPLAGWIAEALKDPLSDGLSPIGAGLHSISIPRPNALRYESAIRMHKLLLVAHGEPREMLKTREILRRSRPEEVNIHFSEEGVQLAA